MFHLSGLQNVTLPTAMHRNSPTAFPPVFRES